LIQGNSIFYFEHFLERRKDLSIFLHKADAKNTPYFRYLLRFFNNVLINWIKEKYLMKKVIPYAVFFFKKIEKRLLVSQKTKKWPNSPPLFSKNDKN